VVAAEHNYPPRLPAGAMWERLRRIAYPRTDRVIMLTSEGLEWLAGAIPRARGVVIPNAVPWPMPTGEPSLDPAAFVPPGMRLLLAVGRLAPQKGFDRAVAAFARVAREHPDWRFVVLGDGDDRAALEGQVAELGLAGRVALPGAAGNIAAWYRRADLFVMSSRFEGFPMTLAEALAHGCPAVSYDCDTGPRDLIADGVNGILVRPEGDIPALASALDRLMGHASAREAMAAAATEVRERYSMERILARWDLVLRGDGS
jgi:glycosyltransferase involved in cell wall biosynthesis